jgi:hypothetical protein
MDLVLCKKPIVVVELGILHGYSLLAMALALKQLGQGKIHAYDLFDDYPYNHGNLSEVNFKLHENKVYDYVDIYKADAYKVHSNYKFNSVDILHVDISNDGTVLKYMVEYWTNILTDRGIMIFEGGSEERDNVEWMIKFNKKPIRKEILSNKIIANNYLYVIHNPFPSITIFFKKGY